MGKRDKSRHRMIEPNVHKSDDKEKVEIDITDSHEWVEKINKTAMRYVTIQIIIA